MERWIRRSVQEPEIKPDLSEAYIAWDGKRVAIINHGYDNVWVSDGLPFDFTHWQYLPNPPEYG